MALVNTTVTLEGIFKRVYDNKVRFIYPNGVRFIKDIPFRGGDKRPGESFNAAITLVFENGMTYLAPAAGAATLLSAAVGQTKRANVDGFQMILTDAEIFGNGLDIEAEVSARADQIGGHRTGRNVRIELDRPGI